MTRLSPLIKLVHNRWAVPVLAALHRNRGAKFITLVNSLGVSRDSLRRTLDALITDRLVCRNFGHGHPLRPEYILTSRGQRAGRVAAPLVKALRKRSDAVYKKWSLPTLVVVSVDASTFNAINRELSEATSRAISLTLKDLEADGLIRRQVEDAHPPTVSYKLTRVGRKLAPLVVDFASVL